MFKIKNFDAKQTLSKNNTIQTNILFYGNKFIFLKLL